MSKHDSILSDNQIKIINEKYAELSDNDIIERLAYLEIVNDEKHIVTSDIEPTKELISISNQIFDIKKDFQKIQVMFKLFVSDVSDFKNLKKDLEMKKSGMFLRKIR